MQKLKIMTINELRYAYGFDNIDAICESICDTILQEHPSFVKVFPSRRISLFELRKILRW